MFESVRALPVYTRIRKWLFFIIKKKPTSDISAYRKFRLARVPQFCGNAGNSDLPTLPMKPEHYLASLTVSKQSSQVEFTEQKKKILN
jgi:hypothetical protein